MIYRKLIKRILDIILSSIALVLLSPLLLLTFIAIYIEDGRPAVFKQQRIGKDGELFIVYKFRSMPNNSKELPSAQADELKITKVGRIIRRLSIDELPQLLNIIKGDMSLVGPRPILPTQTACHNMRITYNIHHFIPGLSGLPQIESHDGMSEAEKVELDKIYCETLSFKNDIKILLRTLLYPLKPPPSD